MEGANAWDKTRSWCFEFRAFLTLNPFHQTCTVQFIEINNVHAMKMSSLVVENFERVYYKQVYVISIFEVFDFQL
jgi:hypothetical protein